MGAERQAGEQLGCKSTKEDLLKYDLKVIEQKITQLQRMKQEIELQLGMKKN